MKAHDATNRESRPALPFTVECQVAISWKHHVRLFRMQGSRTTEGIVKLSPPKVPATLPSSPLRSSERPLITTVIAPRVRPSSRYNSSKDLPDLNCMFDRLLNQIHSKHNNRQNDPRPFEVLWKKTCAELGKRKSATAYAQWKQQSIIKNASDYEALSNELAKTWADTTVTQDEDGHLTCIFSLPGRFEELKRQHEELKPRAKIKIDDILEVAIAYWIEARNAFNQQDSLRALHALLECNFYLGMTYSPKTESESKREIASKAPLSSRDALEGIAFEVMRDFIVPNKLESMHLVIEEIVKQIRVHPGGAEALQAYDEHVQKRKPTDEHIDNRVADALTKWGKTGKPYKRMKPVYDRVRKEFEEKQGVAKHKKMKM